MSKEGKWADNLDILWIFDSIGDFNWAMLDLWPQWNCFLHACIDPRVNINIQRFVLAKLTFVIMSKEINCMLVSADCFFQFHRSRTFLDGNLFEQWTYICFFIVTVEVFNYLHVDSSRACLPFKKKRAFHLNYSTVSIKH